MEFEDGLFRGFKTLNSLLPATNLWCRITEIVLLAHPVKLSRRLVSYKVGYWTSEPDVNSDPSESLVLRVFGENVETFYTMIDSSVTDLAAIEKFCFGDFIAFKAIGEGYKTNLEMSRLLDFYEKRNFPHVITDTTNRQTIVSGFFHKTIFQSDGLNALELISEQGTVVSHRTPYTFDQPFLINNQWVVPLAIQFISPNILKAIVTITN